MKKYILMLLVLILIGAVVAYYTYQQNKQSEKQNAAQVISYIEDIQHLDDTLNLLLFRSSFGIDKNYDNIAKLASSIQTGLKNLKNNHLSTALQTNQALKDIMNQYEAESIVKFDLVENFKTNSSILTNTSNYLPIAGDILIAAVAPGEDDIKDSLETLNMAVHKYMLNYEDRQSKNIIKSKLSQLANYESSIITDDDTLVIEYSSHLKTLLARQEQTRRYLINAVEQPTGNTLGQLSEAYINYSNKLIDRSTNVRNALIAYGILLLASLIFFAFILRRSYLKLADSSQETQQAYCDLQESQEQLIQSEKMASLGQMVAGVAHEINTPLAYINGNVDLIKDNLHNMSPIVERLTELCDQARIKPKNQKKIKELLQTILVEFYQGGFSESYHESLDLLGDSHHGILEIKDLVVNLKNFSRLDRKEAENIDIHDCIESSLKVAAPNIDNYSVKVVTEYSSLPTINCVPSKINQMFLNIVTNAAQAMPGGGTLTIRTKQTDNMVQIDFADTGIGMDAETIEKIFDPFYTTKEVGEGTGLGMSISYKIATSHGGEILVESVKDQGTVIKVRLPIEKGLMNA